MKKRSSKR